MLSFSFFFFSPEFVTFRGDMVVVFETSCSTPGTFSRFLYPFIRYENALSPSLVSDFSAAQLRKKSRTST